MSAAEIEQRAALWLARREDPDWSTDDQAALTSWLDEAMAHKAAFWRLEHGWRAADRIGSVGADVSEPYRPRPRWLPLAAAAALIGVVSLGVLELTPATVARAEQHFATRIGGHRTVALADGSRVELNTATSVRAAMGAQGREVWLDRGEAYFEIRHRSDEPFVVHAGSRTVTVLGTKFSVRRNGDEVTVAVVEGRVRVDDAERPDAVPAAILTAGNVAVARGPSTLLAASSEARVEASLAWRGGMLDFERTPLAEVAAEFNRYNRRQIVIADPAARGIRVGGAFKADNVDAFVRLLHDAYGLQVETDGDSVRISN